MQIFVTDPCPHWSANRLWINSTRAMKMITESMQILACCQKSFTGQVTISKVDGTPYATPLSRMNHPVVKWANACITNTIWLTLHVEALYEMYISNHPWNKIPSRCKLPGFTNVPENLRILKEDYKDYCFNFNSIKFCNFAKADSKGLNFTKEKCVFTAYDRFLKAQGA